MSRLFLTTPIYYVNAAPHLGTFYTTVVGDALSRYHRARYGKDSTFYLTGLDEHGQKIERIARERGVEPQVYCDRIAETFRHVWKEVEIANDDFIRTTSDRHVAAVNEMWKLMEASGDIYLGEYDGLYCVGCEEAKTEDDIVVENGEKLCPIHRKPVERVKEKNYFFRLSKYQQPLLDFYAKNPGFVRPESRLNEVVSFVSSGLRDLSVSRASVKWGIPVPGQPGHVIYVWIDALTNYLTVLGGPNAVKKQEGLGVFWKDARHLIAKDILRFHAVYWPAMLMSAGLPPPREIFCHGYITVKGQKIAKSVPATRVDPVAITREIGADPLRYFVLREYTFGADGDFTYEALFQRHESDLGNDLGNLANRTISMAHRYFGAEMRAFQGTAPTFDGTTVASTIAAAAAQWEAFQPSRALEETWRLVRGANAYIDRSAPWKLSKVGDTAALLEVISNCLELVRLAASMVAPAMPHASAELLRQLGRSADAGTWPDETWRGWPGGHLLEPKPVFPRLEPARQEELVARWSGAAAPAEKDKEAPAVAKPALGGGEIAIEDFAKISLRAAKVLAAERVEKADKLLKLTLDVGEPEPRTVVSGIAKAYAPEALVGKTVILLANLKPAKLRGIVSQGMILAAGEGDALSLATLDGTVPPGSSVR